MSKARLLMTSSILMFQITTFVMIFATIVHLFTLLGIVEAFNARDRLVYFSSVFFNMIFATSLMMTLSCALHQLKSLNTFLDNSFRDKIKMTNNRWLKDLLIIHDKICDIFDGISKFFSLSMIGSALGFTYFNIFFVYEVCLIIQAPSKELLYLVETSILWLFYFTPCVLFVTICASSVKREGTRTIDLIQKFVNDQMRSHELKTLIHLNQQAFHRRPRVSSGLFEPDWEFFFTMLAGIFSFSIILIQFYDVSNRLTK